MHGLGRVLGTKGSGLTLLPIAVSVFTANLFIIKLPNLLCWMHILSLDEFSSDEELLSAHI